MGEQVTQSDLVIHKILSYREFLNLPYHHSDASLFTEITVREEYGDVYIRTNFKIRDCSEAATLDFNCSTDERLEGTLFKAGKLVEGITLFRDKLLEATELLKRKKAEKGVTTHSSNVVPMTVR